MDYHKILTKACVGLVREKPFYGHIVSQMEKVYTDTLVPTMGVGKRKGELLVKFFINEKFLKDSLDKRSEYDGYKYIMEVFQHEVLHIVFDHISISFEDKHRGAIAVDLSVNSYLDKNILNDGYFPEDFELVSEKTATWYYNELEDNEHYQNMPKDDDELHALWEELMKDPLARSKMKSIVDNSKNICSGSYGDVPMGVIENIADFKEEEPIVPWSDVLRNFVAQSCDSDVSHTNKKRSRRYGLRPGLRIEDKLNIAVVVDTSGSMSDEDIAEAFNEIKFIWNNGAGVYVYECDAGIEDEYVYEGFFRGKVNGRGGTNMEPAIVESFKRGFDACIVFTDGYVPLIKDFIPISQLWVYNEEVAKKKPYPFGNAFHVCINNKKLKQV